MRLFFKIIYKTSILFLLLSSCSFFSTEKELSPSDKTLDTTSATEQQIEAPEKSEIIASKIHFDALSSNFVTNFEPTAKQIQKLITYTDSLDIKTYTPLERQTNQILEILKELSDEDTPVAALKDKAVRSRIKGIETFGKLTLYTLQNHPNDSVLLRRGLYQMTKQTKHFIEQVNETEHKYNENSGEDFSL